jgi:hypothetical protein
VLTEADLRRLTERLDGGDPPWRSALRQLVTGLLATTASPR